MKVETIAATFFGRTLTHFETVPVQNVQVIIMPLEMMEVPHLFQQSDVARCRSRTAKLMRLSRQAVTVTGTVQTSYVRKVNVPVASAVSSKVVISMNAILVPDHIPGQISQVYISVH